MSTTFREFLNEQAEKHQAEANAGREIIDEWRTAVESLFGQMRAWLKESDPKGVIEIEESHEEIREPGLGRYRVPRLDLRAFGKWIGIIPKARRTVGAAKPPQKSAPQRAEGRIDITDELRRFVLYRFKENSRDVWLIESPIEGVMTSRPGFLSKAEPKLLDQETFEEALMSYFR